MFRANISLAKRLSKIRYASFCDPIVKVTEYTPVQEKLTLDNFLEPHPKKGEAPIYTPSKKSKFLKKDPFNYPSVKTVKHPETKEEIDQKFKKEPNFTSKFKIDPNDIDDYLIVGAEIFKNKFKEQAKEGKKLEISEKGLEYLSDNYLIKECRKVKDEEFGPQREDFVINDNRTEIEKFYDSRDYINSVATEELRPIFTPSYREKTTRFNALNSFKPQLKNNNRDDHNKELLERLSIASGFKQPFNIFNENIDKSIIALKEVLNESKGNFVYPHDANFAFSSDKLTYSVDLNSYEEVSEFYSPENILKLSSSITNLLNELDNIDYIIIPNLLLKLFFEVNLNIKQVWIKIENIVLNNLTSYSIEDLCKINFVANIASPHYSTLHFRNLLKAEITKNKLENYSFSDIINIVVGFRFNKDSSLFAKLSTTLVNNLENYIKNNKKEKKENIITKVAYALSLCRPSQYKQVDYVGLREDNSNNFMIIQEDIFSVFPSLNLDQILLIVEAAAKLEIEFCDGIVNKMERYVLSLLKAKKEISPKDIGKIFKQLNQMRKGRMAGSDLFILKLLIHCQDNLSSYEINDFLEIMYASSSRRLEYNSENILNLEMKKQVDEIHEKINSHLKSQINNLTTFQQLSLIFYHLMYTKNEDTKLIDALLEKCDKINGLLTIKYYNSFKYFDFYLRKSKALSKKYNLENLMLFRDRFFYSEQVFNVVKSENFYNEELRLLDINSTLNNRLDYHTTFALPYKNLFIIPIALETRKIAIFIYFDRDYVINTRKTTAKALLSSEMMKLNDDWEVMSMTWDEYLKLGNAIEREKKIFDMIETLTDKQIEKGEFKRNRRII